jgi:hypothetical protein
MRETYEIGHSNEISRVDGGWKHSYESALSYRKEWWPERGLNRRRRPFQGVNKQYLQLLKRRRGTPSYAEIRVRRANHGWGIAGGECMSANKPCNEI